MLTKRSRLLLLPMTLQMTTLQPRFIRLPNGREAVTRLCTRKSQARVKSRWRHLPSEPAQERRNAQRLWMRLPLLRMSFIRIVPTLKWMRPLFINLRRRRPQQEVNAWCHPQTRALEVLQVVAAVARVGLLCSPLLPHRRHRLCPPLVLQPCPPWLQVLLLPPKPSRAFPARARAITIPSWI